MACILFKHIAYMSVIILVCSLVLIVAPLVFDKINANVSMLPDFNLFANDLPYFEEEFRIDGK